MKEWAVLSHSVYIHKHMVGGEGAHGLSEWRGSAVRLYLLAAFDTTGASEAKCQTGKMTCGMQGDTRRRAVRE